MNDEHNINEQSSELQAQIERCTAELQEYKNKVLYLTAEFDNYKKRTEKERIQWITSGQAMVLDTLLAIYDDFERATKQIHAQHLPQEVMVHLQGLDLIAKSFEKAIKQYDIEEMTYDEFDPEKHEALMQVQSSEHKPGQIVQVLQKGYVHKGKLLRAAKVSVAQ